MPIARFEMPDGRIARFEVPEGTTPEQAQNAFETFMVQRERQSAPLDVAPAEGITGRARAGRVAPVSEQRILGEREAALAALSPERRELIESISPLEAGLIGAGRGLTTIGRAIGLAAPEDEATRQAIEDLRAQQPALTVGEVAAEAAPFLIPGAAAGAIPRLGARALATGAVGAAEGVTIAKGRGGDVKEQFLAGGTGGAIAGGFELVVPVIGRLGGRIIRRVTGKAPKGAVVDAAGKPSAELVDALEQSGQSFDDLTAQAQRELQGQAADPEQAARKAFLESQGLTPTRAQVTRNAADFQAQQEAAKTSSIARTALEEQESVLTTRFNNAVLETGGQADAPTATVFDALTEKATVLDQEISDLYRLARETAPGEKNVRFGALAGKLRKLAPQDRATDGAIDAIVGDLKTRGVLDDNLRVTGRISVETAEDVRKLANELFDPQKPFRNAKLRELKDALDDDVFRAQGDDIFNQGRAAKRDFEKGLSRAKISKFDSRKSNIVRDVLENKVNPDNFANDVVFSKKWRGSDIQQLKDYISDSPSGTHAFDDLRADVLSTIKEKSFIGPEDAAGNKALSRDKLQKAISSVGREKINVLFTGQEQKFLKDLLQVSRLREPVRGTALGRGPSAQAITRSVAGIESRLAESQNILGALVAAIGFDKKGRAVIKGSAERVVEPIASSPVRGALATTGAAVGVSQTQQQQQ